MSAYVRMGFYGLVTAVLGSGCTSVDGDGAGDQQAQEVCLVERAAAGSRVLVFSHTAGYRHASIPIGVAAVRTLGERFGFMVEHTEDPTEFTDDRLGEFGAVLFLSTTGDVLDRSQEAALERFVQAGGGYVGVHAPPADGVTILATLDENSYEGAEMGGVHPIAWYHEFDGGRAWYTGLGHTDETYSEQAFLDHLAGGILWALDGD